MLRTVSRTPKMIDFEDALSRRTKTAKNAKTPMSHSMIGTGFNCCRKEYNLDITHY
jgi:hypothetical protein